MYQRHRPASIAVRALSPSLVVFLLGAFVTTLDTVALSRQGETHEVLRHFAVEHSVVFLLAAVVTLLVTAACTGLLLAISRLQSPWRRSLSAVTIILAPILAVFLSAGTTDIAGRLLAGPGLPLRFDFGPSIPLLCGFLVAIFGSTYRPPFERPAAA